VCCLLWAGFLAFQHVVDNTRGTRVEQVVSSFPKILRDSQLTWYLIAQQMLTLNISSFCEHGDGLRSTLRQVLMVANRIQPMPELLLACDSLTCQAVLIFLGKMFQNSYTFLLVFEVV